MATADTDTTQDKVIIENNVVTTQKQQSRYYSSDQCQEARILLHKLVENPAYDTESSYYQANASTFVERHLQYLSTHSVSNLPGYISNLKLMTRVKA